MRRQNWERFLTVNNPSHRFNGKTPVEDIIHTMKELVEYEIHFSVCAMLHANF